MAAAPGSKASRTVWSYLAIVAFLTFVGHWAGAELWDREWKSTDQSGDPELGGLYRFLGLTGGFTLAIILVLTHAVWRARTDRAKDDGSYYDGVIVSVPMDLDAEARDSEGAACHVCSAPAKVIVEMRDPMSNIGSAIFLCDEDFQFASIGDRDALCTRLAANYEEPASEMVETAMLMIDGTGRSVRLVGRNSD